MLHHWYIRKHCGLIIDDSRTDSVIADCSVMVPLLREHGRIHDQFRAARETDWSVTWRINHVTKIGDCAAFFVTLWVFENCSYVEWLNFCSEYSTPEYATPDALHRKLIVLIKRKHALTGCGTWHMNLGFFSREVQQFSTPFVFLTDTFTGEFLCGRYVSGGHAFSNCAYVLNC